MLFYTKTTLMTLWSEHYCMPIREIVAYSRVQPASTHRRPLEVLLLGVILANHFETAMLTKGLTSCMALAKMPHPLIPPSTFPLCLPSTFFPCASAVPPQHFSPHASPAHFPLCRCCASPALSPCASPTFSPRASQFFTWGTVNPGANVLDLVKYSRSRCS